MAHVNSDNIQVSPKAHSKLLSRTS